MNFFRTVVRHSIVGQRAFSTLPETFTATSNIFSVAPKAVVPTTFSLNPFMIPDMSISNINAVEDMQNAINYEMMNRNKRKLKKANHGARPCNSRGRKARRIRRHLYA